MPVSRNPIGVMLRVLVGAACCLGIWDSLALARADLLLRQDTERSVRLAVHFVPDGWQYYMRLAQLDRTHAQELLETSLLLNRFDAQARIELGLQYEAVGDFNRAEKQLLEAYSVDHTYLPRWSLANYYFRRGNMPAFWVWARSAADMPADDIGGLLELCWRVSPDPELITATILNEKPEFLRQYVGFLLTKDQPVAAARVAPNLIHAGNAESDLPVLFTVINRLVAANEAAAAYTLWKQLMEHQWVLADRTVPNNSSFLRDPLPVSFDWSIPEFQGLHSWPGPSGLETEFTGSEPENCTIAEQSVILTPARYAMTYEYRTSDIAPASGIRWQIVDPKSHIVLAESGDFSSNEIKQSELDFLVPPGASLVSLKIAYRRPLGTVRVSGMLHVQTVQIKAIPTT